MRLRVNEDTKKSGRKKPETETKFKTKTQTQTKTNVTYIQLPIPTQCLPDISGYTFSVISELERRVAIEEEGPEMGNRIAMQHVLVDVLGDHFTG
jgi:hypothetical protein